MKHSKTSKKPNAIVLAGYGLNCEDETAFALETAGAKADIVHINDVIDQPKMLKKYQILIVPGGFSFGDDLGSGKAFAIKLKQHLQEELHEFIQRDTLMAGLCNGFQILTSAGLLPGALTFNDSHRYISRWVDVDIVSTSPWTVGITRLSLPIAHGEGKYCPDPATKPVVAMRYVENPNGSIDDIAGVLGYNGRILGMMPHPERSQFSWQRGGRGLQFFKNAVQYFQP